MANNDRHPNAWIEDMRRVVDTRLMQDIVNDFRSYNPHPTQDPSAKVVPQGAGKVVDADVGPQHRPYEQRSGWVTPPQVDQWKAPGIEHVDRLVDERDRLDRAARIRELGAAEHSLRLAEAAREAEAKEKAPKDGNLKP